MIGELLGPASTSFISSPVGVSSRIALKQTEKLICAIKKSIQLPINVLQSLSMKVTIF